MEAAAIVEAMLLAVGLISSLLDAAPNHQRERAPCDVVMRDDVHQAVRDMRVCLHRVLPRHRNTDPIWDSPTHGGLQPQPPYETSGSRMDVLIGMRSPKYKNYCATSSTAYVTSTTVWQ